MLRFGIVSNRKEDSLCVIVPAKDNTVSAYIPLLANMAQLPQVGQPVACIFEGEGLEKGICLGLYYNADFRVQDKVVIDRDMEIAGKVTVQDDMHIGGNQAIDGNLSVSGNINYGGSITGGGG